jgi:Tfp pilus assembly protein PilF
LNKQLDEAETSLSRCLQLDPDHVLARINRVLVHLQSGNKTLAEVDIAYLETYHPEQPRLKALKDYLDTI